MIVTETTDYENVIRECYKSDSDLINIYHIKAGEGLESCVSDTVNELKNNTDKSFKFYSIQSQPDVFFGFFGIEHFDEVNYLTSFFLVPQFRIKDSKKLFWEIITSCFENTLFKTAINIKNIRGLNFCYEQGGRIENLVLDREKYWLIFTFK